MRCSLPIDPLARRPAGDRDRQVLHASRPVVGGADTYLRFLDWSASPWVLTLNAASFLFMIYHAITFFVAAPQALVVHVGRRPVPAQLVLAGHYLAWAAASALVVWVLTRP